VAWRKRKPDHRLIVRDKDCRGLALIVNPTATTWSYSYRPRGSDPVTGRRWPNRAVTLGNPASLSVDDARMEANRIKGQAAVGADPSAERKARVETERRQRGATLGRLADEYAKAFTRRAKVRGAGLPSPRYVEEEMRQLKLAIAEMDAMETPAALLTDADVGRLLAVGSNLHARFGALFRFLDWCQDAGYVKANPCLLIARTRRPKARQPRAHFLTPAELARLWLAAGHLEEPVWRDVARFLIATPCRRGEAALLEGSHVDLATAEWRQPSHMTKNGEPHRLYLHAMALEVLQARRKAFVEAQVRGVHQKVAPNLADGAPRSGLVFPAPVSGEVLQTFSAIKAALAAATGPQDGKEGSVVLDGWTWHDFRRSFATALGEAGVSETVADSILNHRQSATRGGVLGVYQRASRWPEQVRAMDLWGKLLAEAITGAGPPANVVPMVAHVG
jgi:integrase